MERVLEDELMLGVEQARAYAEADFSTPNQAFCDLVFAKLGELPSACRVVDLGCGPADIPLRLAAQQAHWQFDAIDGSPAMLEQASARITAGGYASRVRLVQAYLSLQSVAPAELKAHSYDLVLSNSLLHHLPDPQVLWQGVQQLGKAGAAVFVADLLRPDSEAEAKRLLDEYASGEPEILRRDFLCSLRAAFRIDEVRAQLVQARLTALSVEQVSDRHLVVFGRLPGAQTP